MHKYCLVGIVALFLFTNRSFSQSDTLNLSINNKKILIFISSEAIAYSASMIALNSLWYKDFERTSFHWFNDSNEWLQMDKMGHGFSSYYLTEINELALRKAGVKSKNAILTGSLIGFSIVSSIEIFDGFSSEWGASASDLAANASGSLLYSVQQYAFNEQVIVPKFSFLRSSYSKYRPSILGGSLQEELFKDYNGQTYWLSANLKRTTNIGFIPNWLNLAAGYGAGGLLGGKQNPSPSELTDNVSFERERQFYLSFDIDLSKIKTKSILLSKILKTINIIKVPAPTLELKNNKLSFHPLFF